METEREGREADCLWASCLCSSTIEGRHCGKRKRQETVRGNETGFHHKVTIAAAFFIFSHQLEIAKMALRRRESEMPIFHCIWMFASAQRVQNTRGGGAKVTSALMYIRSVSVCGVVCVCVCVRRWREVNKIIQPTCSDAGELPSTHSKCVNSECACVCAFAFAFGQWCCGENSRPPLPCDLFQPDWPVFVFLLIFFFFFYLRAASIRYWYRSDIWYGYRSDIKNKFWIILDLI